MIVLTVNAGSTSVRLGAFDATRPAATRELMRERHAGHALDPPPILRAFVRKVGSTGNLTVAHRVVHGGTEFAAPTVLDEAALTRLRALTVLAPLHNPEALRWIDAARGALDAATRHVAVFDTAFFAALPPQAARYAVPREWADQHGLRRYGFHGLAHESMWRSWTHLRADLDRGGRLITLQLGGGCSIAAIQGGHPLDTSMGFSPLEGLVMATRSGDIDAAAVPYLASRLGQPVERILEMLNRESGLRGISGGKTDVSELLDDPSPAAQLALEMFCVRARKYVGAYLALLNGCDGIAFGGGIGENVPEVRRRVLAAMEWAGIALDATANAHAVGNAGRISTPESPVEVRVMRVDEERELCRSACSVLEAG